MAEITGVFNGIQTPWRVYPLPVEPLGPLGGVGIMAVAAGILAYTVASIKVIPAGRVVRVIIHNGIFVSNGRGYGMGVLDPSRFIMTEKADDLLTGMLRGVMKPVGPQKLGIVHLMGIVTGGALDRVIHPQGLAIKPAHGANSTWV
jgi:hypothetical protein